jgi:hypothetical protein
MSHRIAHTFIAFVTLTTIGLAIGPAHAAAADDCVVVLQPASVAPDGAIVATAVDLGCYATFADALSIGASGAIHVGDSMTPAALTDAILAADTDAAVTSNVLIGTEYNNTAYTGSSNSYFASETCSTGVVWELADLGVWNNVYSSGKGFGGCDTNKKFESQNFGGTVLTCTPNCGDYGSLRNRVSSLRWKP